MVKIGVVIPTAFNRPQYLPLSYDSVLGQKGDFQICILVGCPEEKIDEVQRSLPAGATVVAEPKEPGLAKKLDGLLRQLPSDCEYIAWLGDDDLLTEGSLSASLELISQNPNASMIYGGCDYIDAAGRIIFSNGSGAWAGRILNYGPQLIPQPGSLMRASSYLAVGGLSNKFSLAFDFDLFLKLKSVGELLHVPRTLAQFRWHPASLSVKRRMVSALEASRVRREHYRGLARFFWPFWEPFVILATWMAGKLVSLRTARLVK